MFAIKVGTTLFKILSIKAIHFYVKKNCGKKVKEWVSMKSANVNNNSNRLQFCI